MLFGDWIDNVRFDKFLLPVTDYTKKAAGILVSYPKLMHVACAAHAFHGVWETARVICPNVDKFVVNGKKMFVKSPAGMELLKTKL